MITHKHVLAFLVVVLLLIPDISFAAVPNFMGIRIGMSAPYYNGESETTGWSGFIKGAHAELEASFGKKTCYTREALFKNGAWVSEGNLKGDPVFTPDLNAWSPFAAREACRSNSNKSNFGHLYLYISNKKIPAETDIRVCVQPRDDGSASNKVTCTPWASQSTGWQDMAWAYQNGNSKKYPDGYRLLVETRPLPGRSITDVRLRARLKSAYDESSYIKTKWTSQGGGWVINKNTAQRYTGFSAFGEFVRGLQIGVAARTQNVTKPDLWASVGGINAGGSTVQGSVVSFWGTVHNSGDASTGNSFTSRFEYRYGGVGGWLPLGDSVQGVLNPGTSVWTSSQGLQLTQSGPLQVRLCSDIWGGIPEWNDNNNCSQPVEYQISGRPNLHVNSLASSPSGSIIEGTPVTFTGVVRNGGNSAAAASIARYCINGTSCTDHGVGTLGNGGTETETRSWTPSAPGTYTVRLCADATNTNTNESNESDNCSGTGGSANSLTITVNPRPVVQNPTATLRVRNITTGGSWTSTSPLEITAGHDIELDWDGRPHATSCQGVNFDTGGSIDNSTTNVTEPTVGNATTYSVRCDDTNGATPAATAQIRVEATAATPELTASKTTVLTGEPFTLSWSLNGNDPANCVLTGAGSTYTAPGSITSPTGNTTITASGSATYTLDCAAGDDSVTIQVLPQVFEN